MDESAVIELAKAAMEFPAGLLRRRRVLDGVDLVVRRGEALGVVGPSGAGKTTLLKMMLGLLRPGAGEVRLFGGEPRGAACSHTIGYAPDDHGLPPGLSGRETLALHAHLLARRADAPGAAVGTERMSGALGMADALEERTAGYSPGMRSRLAFLAAMSGDPEFVVLDDPFAGIDPEMRGVMRDKLKSFAGRGGTLVVSSHLLLDLGEIVTRAILVHGGRVAADARASEIFPAADAWYASAVKAS